MSSFDFLLEKVVVGVPINAILRERILLAKDEFDSVKRKLDECVQNYEKLKKMYEKLQSEHLELQGKHIRLTERKVIVKGVLPRLIPDHPSFGDEE